ncbi:MAG TPA: alpha-ribazole phosphatase [Porphyromonadaceae bacterium]|jgi:alpha-ribazole phosphatase|uniref:alpha-ribazole phosphatase n=1 Tax=Limibacterium fermenti TaxID=3229863 RepID=UPI000E832C8F|nr:alpha-ribazole phosphatase [Porphyromonadaceae bacterium]HBK31938.1 alpha-ribazole phosphatase [Porphyromonadaceae bacterium]HBL34147.1 alpha-ribazole phosphatase [Porphyromonadaceae bacterium]HBX19755.1 alpha-ribazole phosphatase [Porphyromonadaceae bacterium]HBX44496.1 alpha-ribazole phosphatase [Porphyromonadaceae bacterium]
MKLYVVRHTRVDVPKGICYGQTDVPLADTFAEEARTIVQQLQNIPFTHVFSSPLSRCMRLAKEISPNVTKDIRLQELNFGQWEGCPWSAIYETEAGKRWFADYVNTRCPGGESYRDMLARAESFLAEIPSNAQEVLLVTHAGIVRTFATLLEKNPPEEAFNRTVGYGQITTFLRTKQAR